MHASTHPKSATAAYLCWLIVGAHYLYLRRPGIQLAFWLTLGGLGIWALADLFRIPRMVDAYNTSGGTTLDSREAAQGRPIWRDARSMRAAAARGGAAGTLLMLAALAATAWVWWDAYGRQMNIRLPKMPGGIDGSMTGYSRSGAPPAANAARKFTVVISQVFRDNVAIGSGSYYDHDPTIVSEPETLHPGDRALRPCGTIAIQGLSDPHDAMHVTAWLERSGTFAVQTKHGPSRVLPLYRVVSDPPHAANHHTQVPGGWRWTNGGRTLLDKAPRY